jgi:hypothetical protein
MITAPATEAEPRRPDSFADFESADARSECFDDSNYLMSGDDRILGLVQFSIQYVQVRPADSAGGYPDQNLLLVGCRFLTIDQAKWRSGFFE